MTNLTDRQRSILLTALQGLDLHAVQLGIEREEITTLLQLFAEPLVMPRYDPRFIAADHQSMWEGALEEAADLSTKEIAELVMDNWDLVSCIAACSVIDGNHIFEPLAEMLQWIDNKEDEEYNTGEFLREHDNGDGYPALLDFAVRMSLLNDDETELTDLGHEFVENNLL